MLVVDDEQNVRTLCQQVLSEAGYNVIEAKDGEKAIRKVGQENPDLVILDIQMSRMDGMEALPKNTAQKKKDACDSVYRVQGRLHRLGS